MPLVASPPCTCSLALIVSAGSVQGSTVQLVYQPDTRVQTRCYSVGIIRTNLHMTTLEHTPAIGPATNVFHQGVGLLGLAFVSAPLGASSVIVQQQHA